VQAQLWAARAADACDETQQAQQWRSEALQGNGPHVRPLQALVRSEQTQAVSRKRLRALTYNIDLVDATL